jgi:hypothetical protein
MKKEINEFFINNNEQLEYIIQDAKIILNANKINDQRSFVLLNIIFNYIKEEKIEFLVNKLNEIVNESSLYLISSFIKEDQMNIIDYFSNISLEKEESYPKLIDFEWKFVGLSHLNNFEKGEIFPKIFIKLKFNNETEKILETDYSNLKKLQEEIEENLTSFNSTYAKRIEAFSK